MDSTQTAKRQKKDQINEAVPAGWFAPPCNIEAEQSVLGAMLIEREAIDKAVEILHADDFYRLAHQQLFEMIVYLASWGGAVDIITLQDELKNRDLLGSIGGMPYIAALFDTVPTAANVEYYARIVEDKALLRKLMHASVAIRGIAIGEVDNVDDSLNEAQKIVLGIERNRVDDDLNGMGALCHVEINELEHRAVSGNEITGLSTGLSALDIISCGMQREDLIIIAARPSMGKTSIVRKMMDHWCSVLDVPVSMFSLDMTKSKVAAQMICTRAAVDTTAWRKGVLTYDEMERVMRATSEISRYKLEPFGREYNTPSDVLMKARQVKRKYGESGPIVIDYLSRMRKNKRGSQSKNRNEELGSIVIDLKDIGCEMGVPVIVLSQLNRGVEIRENKRPTLGDLRDSGEIEQEADFVAFLYRESYYKRKDEIVLPGVFQVVKDPIEEQVEIIIAKQRMGPTGMVKVGFVAEWARFQDLDFYDDSLPTGF